jgi:hypothetical protein
MMMNTDYFNEAFNGFDPRTDKDAAMKFCLNAVLMDRRFADLQGLLTDETDLGGIAGEPNWIIERRDEGEIKGYEAWPEFARFRAFVDPGSYELAYPEFFCDKFTFEKFVSSGIRAYCDRHPDKNQEVESILQKLSVNFRR